MGAHSAGSKISLVTATGIVVSNMVGTGAFTSLGFQVGPLPSAFAILILWLVGGVCALCGALAYGELAAALPRSGGEYHFLSRIYHPLAGFLAGWLSATVGFAAPIALAAMAFGQYFLAVLPDASALGLSIAVTAIVTAVHLRGIDAGARFQNAATGLKVLLILAFLAAGFFAPAAPAVSFAPQADAWELITSAPFALSLIYVMYAYSGWNASTYISGEVRDPARNLPRSVAIGTFLVMGLYLALQAVFMRVAPFSELAGKVDVGHVAALHIFGKNGGQLMAGLISLGLVSSISAMTWIGPRVAMTMGEDYPLLAPLARRSARGVPAVGMLVQFTLVVLLLCTATFDQVLTYVQFSLTLCSFLVVLGVMVLRYREPNLARPSRTWGYPLTPLLFLAISAWMLFHIGRSKPWESLAGAGTLALGAVAYAFTPKRSPTPPELTHV